MGTLQNLPPLAEVPPHGVFFSVDEDPAVRSEVNLKSSSSDPFSSSCLPNTPSTSCQRSCFGMS
eukprot:6472433-Amphidinium_carterae.1